MKKHDISNLNGQRVHVWILGGFILSGILDVTGVTTSPIDDDVIILHDHNPGGGLDLQSVIISVDSIVACCKV